MTKRFIYADPGLVDNRGHHANSCRAITRVLRDRGIDVQVLASRRLDPALRDELQAKPFFSVDPYRQTDGDPISGWLNAFYAAAPQTQNDFRQLTDCRKSDLLYMAFGLAPHLLGLGTWLAEQKNAPTAVMDMIMEPGVDVETGPGGITAVLRDPRIDPRAVLYRFTGLQLNALKLERLFVATCEPTASALYQHLLQRPVDLVPFPHTSGAAPKDRSGRRPITLTLMGHQQPNKGFHLMPDVIRRLLRSHRDIRIVAHNSAPGTMSETQSALKAIARDDQRLTVDERALDSRAWQELLAQTDIMVCPYLPAWYRVATSGIAAEAIAGGIPLVAPADTTLSHWADEFGGAGAIFGKFDVHAITVTLEKAIKSFDLNAARAVAGAMKWAETHSPARYVDALLQIAERS
jgi:hypothetical protein